MSDVEFMTQRNWEQRRHAEEYAAKLAEENKVVYLERTGRGDRQPGGRTKALSVGFADSSPRGRAKGDTPRKWEPRKRNRRWMAKAAKTAGRMALVMSAASALAGLELVFPLFGLVAVIFYTLNFEFQEGRNGLWQKMG